MNCDDFQNVDPMVFVTISELLGNVMAGNMPFNVQNAVGNWLTLMGQVIVTYNAQQQYFVEGPGEYFDCRKYNSENPNNNESTETTENSKEKNSGTGNEKVSIDDIKEIKKSMEELLSEITSLKKEIAEIKKNNGSTSYR